MLACVGAVRCKTVCTVCRFTGTWHTHKFLNVVLWTSLCLILVCRDMFVAPASSANGPDQLENRGAHLASITLSKRIWMWVKWLVALTAVHIYCIHCLICTHCFPSSFQSLHPSVTTNSCMYICLMYVYVRTTPSDNLTLKLNLKNAFSVRHGPLTHSRRSRYLQTALCSAGDRQHCVVQRQEQRTLCTEHEHCV